MILLLFVGLFLSAPLVPDGHVAGCLILTADLMQLRPCRPCEFERWAC